MVATVGGCIDRRTGKVTLIQQEMDPAELDRLVKALLSAGRLGEATKKRGESA